MTGDYSHVPSNTDLFELKEVIGSGSFSNVYKAVDKRTNGIIALKVYRSKMDEEYYSRAAAEMAFLRFLEHPRIIKYIFSEIKPEYMCLATEYSSNYSLHVYIRNSDGLAESLVKHIMKQLMSAVCYIHSMYILHGDIKPENLIVYNEDNNKNIIIKLCDFGLSDIVKTPEANRKKAGSFFYMAPEILLGFPYDYTADIFSAGVVMYEMLFGKRPFGKDVTKEAYLGYIKRRAQIELPQPSSSLSETCCNFMAKLLCYDKQNRLVGEALTKHPFIGAKYAKDNQNHYMKACECLVKGIGFVNAQEIGQGYLEVKEAILHLKIHLNSITQDDALCHYVTSKYNEYAAYANLIEQRLLSNNITGPIDAGQLLQSERLRLLLRSTPPLLIGYDICSVGEMYYKEGNRQQALRKIKQGLEMLFPLVMAEPDGLRKYLLVLKIDEWMKIMETMNRLGEARRLQPSSRM